MIFGKILCAKLNVISITFIDRRRIIINNET